jgi:hypothetical protein
MAAVGLAWLAIACVAGARANGDPVTLVEAGTAGSVAADQRSAPGEQLVSSTASSTAASTDNQDADGSQDAPVCARAPADDPEPWKWDSRLLASFPPDVPTPAWVGSYGDAHQMYQLDLWRDSQGIFGEFRNPVLEADSPTSRLYDVRFDSASGKLEFRVQVPVEDTWFSGTLRHDSVAGTLRYRDVTEELVWRRRPDIDPANAGDEFYTSRAQFECAMTLWHRYGTLLPTVPSRMKQ